MICFAEGCRSTRIAFTPHFYVGDFEKEGITNAKGETVLANDPFFNEFGCLHKEEIKELLRVLKGVHGQKILKSTKKGTIDNLFVHPGGREGLSSSQDDFSEAEEGEENGIQIQN
jgi:hypothetical protein